MFGKLGLKADYATEGKRKLYIFSFFYKRNIYKKRRLRKNQLIYLIVFNKMTAVIASITLLRIRQVRVDGSLAPSR